MLRRCYQARAASGVDPRGAAMRVLLLYPYLPHPRVAHGSGRLVAALLDAWRARGVEVGLVCGYRDAERSELEATARRVSWFHPVRRPLRADLGVFGRVKETVRTAWREATTGRPRFVVKLDRAETRRAVRDALEATRYDLAQVELAGFASYVDLLGGLPSALIDHEAGAASGDALATDPRALRFVRDFYPRFGRVGALCEEDAADLGAAAPIAPFLRRPGTHLPPGDGPAPERGRLLFFGSAEHAPNLDALRRLAADLWPKIRARAPEATLHVAAGPLGSDLESTLAAAGIGRLGFVADIAKEIRRASVIVAPLHKGRGVRIKNLEALAAGRALVTTTLGARGLLIRSGVHAEIADSSDEFADAAARLAAAPEIAARLGAAGREHVARTFTHDAAADANVAVWRALLR
ncbi:MAG TPA: glycosyltransferase [Planctomycetota bacterium]|nr:glycosyltransferase [Planctomycetota bacterium]